MYRVQMKLNLKLGTDSYWWNFGKPVKSIRRAMQSLKDYQGVFQEESLRIAHWYPTD